MLQNNTTRITNHAVRHQNGGGDEISVADLSGLLTDPQTPLAHNQLEATITDLDKYTQSEVVGLISTHTAIVAAHHARYTDAEAVTAAKTVKLDDFATPDDNTDLDVDTSRHGLVPKGTGVGYFLRDDGTWAAEAGAGDVLGPASATDHAVARFNTTTGKLLQDSVVIITDGGGITGVTTLAVGCSPSGSYQVEIGCTALQFALPSLNVAESEHAVSHRASIGLGLDAGATLGWIIGQDSSGGGFRDFYIRDQTAGANRFVILTTGAISMPGTLGCGAITSTGAVTGTNLNVANWDTAYGWGDHAGLYDPVGTMTTHETTYDHAHYDTAYGWGNHAGLYDPAGTMTTHETTYNHGHYDTAYGWGDHGVAGYAPVDAPTFTTSVTIPQTADDGTYTGIVTNDSGVLKYRTKAEILSDIGAEASGAVATHEATYNHNNYNDAYTAMHTQGTDTTLGTMTANIDMDGSYQVVGLQAPAANGEAIRQTAKITETNMETAYDHSQAAHAPSNADNTAANETSHADVLIDGDFGSAGLMKTNGAGTYSIVTDNSGNWNTAYGWGDHAGLYSLVAHLHDTQTIEPDGITSDGGAFPFTTSGIVTFNQIVAGEDPTAASHLATRRFVELVAAGSAKDFFLSDTDDSVVADTHVMYPAETGEGASTEISDGETAGADQLIFSFLTPAGEPGIIHARAGIYTLHMHLHKGSGDPTTAISWRLVKVDADGSSGRDILMLGEVSDNLTTSSASYETHAYLANGVTFASTSRYLLEILSNVSGGGTSQTTITMEGNHDCHLSIKVPSDIFQTQGDVLDDLNTLGTVASDGQFIVGTGAGAFAYESGATVRTSLSVYSTTESNALITTHESTYNHGNYNTAYNWGDHASGGYAISGGAEHDGFSDYDANDHIDHTGVSISTGTGLDGGGDISATRTLSIDVDGLDEIGAALVDADTFIVDDGDSGTTKKCTMSRLATYIGGGGGGDVSAAANMTDHSLVRGDGGAKGVQDSGWVLTDGDVLEAAGDLDMGDNDITGLRDIKPYDGEMNIQMSLPGTVYIKGTVGPDPTAVLMLHCDGNDGATATTDDSDSNHTVNFYNQSQLDTAIKKFGTASLLFDGTDYVDITDSLSDFAFGTESFTIEFQYYAITTGSQKAFMASHYSVGAPSWIIRTSGAGQLTWYSTSTGNNNMGTMTTGAWHHIMLVRDADNGNRMDFYVDGVSIGNWIEATDFSTENKITIGDDGHHSTLGFHGHLDEIRISKGIARQTGNFDPPTEAYGAAITTAANLNIQDNLDVGGDTTIVGTLNVTGASTLGTVECGAITSGSDTDIVQTFGRGKFGFVGTNDYLGVGHIDQWTTQHVAVHQGAAGDTYIQAGDGQAIRFRPNGAGAISFTLSSDGSATFAGNVEMGTLDCGVITQSGTTLANTYATLAEVSTPIFWNMLTAAPDAVGQGTWARVISDIQPYCGAFFTSTHNDGDNFTCNFRCPAGTYTLRFNARKTSNEGIIDVDIDGSEEGSFDLYAAAADYLNIAEITGLTLSAGAHTLRFRIDGKNASSGFYQFYIEGIWLQRTA